MEKLLYPNVLQCNKFEAKSSLSDSRTVTDYEIDFYIDGEREICIDGRCYKTGKNCVVVRRPGQFVKSLGDYNMFMLTLDFSQKKNIVAGSYIRGSERDLQETCENELLSMLPDVFYPHHSEDMLALLETVSRYSYPNIVNKEMQKQALAEFLLLLFSDAFEYRRGQQQFNPKKSYTTLASEYIVKNYSKPISVDSLAKHLALNKNYLIKLFKKSFSTTPNRYILKVRLYHAELMLTDTDLSVENIAEACGFSTTSYFIKRFKECYGETPFAYRNKRKV